MRHLNPPTPTRGVRWWWILIGPLVVGWSAVFGSTADGQAVAPETPPAATAASTLEVSIQHQVRVPHDAITESSGLFASRRDPTCVWTHNDSGDSARLFAIETATGRCVGEWVLAIDRPVDWEDMTGFSDGERSRLVIADCGDNASKRSSIQLIVIDEPDPRSSGVIAKSDVRSITVRYPGGPMDCEAVWWDADRHAVMLLAKRWLGSAELLAAVLPVDVPPDVAPKHSVVIANAIGRLPAMLVTGADVDPKTGEIWVISYWHVWKFSPSQFAGNGAKTPIATWRAPAWKQIEAITLDGVGNVWISTEGSPMLLGRLGF